MIFAPIYLPALHKPSPEYTITGEVSLERFILSENNWDYVYYNQDFDKVKKSAKHFAQNCKKSHIKYYKVWRNYLRTDNMYYVAVVKKLR